MAASTCKSNDPNYAGGNTVSSVSRTRQLQRAMRLGGLTASTAVSVAILLALNSCGGPSVVVAPIEILTLDINSVAVTATTEVTRVDNGGICEYRLEFKDPSANEWSISEVGGNRGPAQRIQSCDSTPPSFNATAKTNAAWFEEQTVYFWAKKARDYAKAALWVTPPGWEGNSPKFANAELGPNVLKNGGDDGGFATACFPRDPGGCMRFWPGQNPKIFIKAGGASAELVGHEYGHYAAGFVFGHMDTSGINGFDITNCVHRSFQEAIAETFNKLFRHHELNSGGPVPVPGWVSSLSAQWINECATDEYPMGDPLWQSFTQAVWGTGMDLSGKPISVPWSSPAQANTAMVNAFTYGLATTHDFGIHRLAQAALDHIGKNQSSEIATAVRAIFASHGLTPAVNGGQCVENDECASNYCDRGDGTSKTSLCMPAAASGAANDPCSNDNQCASNYCANLVTDRDGKWIPGKCATKIPNAQTCLSNGECASNYCDRGNNTSRTNVCLPGGGTGTANEPCSHDNQCASGHCAGLELGAFGRWQLGRCSTKATLGQFCLANADCDSKDCDVGANAAGTNLCTPPDHAGQLNDVCTQHGQCASGFCAELRTGANGIPIAGCCALVGGLGQACSTNSECASQYCDRGNNTSHTGLCLPSGGSGVPNDLCSNDSQCVTNNCAGLTATNAGNWIPGHCAFAAPLGQSCLANSQCQSGYCDSGNGTSHTNRCMPRGGTGAVGNTCSNDIQCISGNCNGLAQNPASEWLPGSCAAKLGLGMQCSSNNYCQSGYCDAGNGTSHTSQCMPGPGAGLTGQKCSNDNQCSTGNCAGLTTDAYNNWIPGLCAAKRTLGTTCGANSECQSTYCDAGFNTSNTNKCMPRGGTGVPGNFCTHNTQCASGNCNSLTKDASGNWVPGNCL